MFKRESRSLALERSRPPAAILSALGFMEKSGGVALGDRMANQQTLKNMVNQSVMDLESGADPTKKAPLLPLVLGVH